MEIKKRPLRSIDKSGMMEYTEDVTRALPVDGQPRVVFRSNRTLWLEGRLLLVLGHQKEADNAND